MLSDTAIKKVKPGDKPIRMFDGGGLYLEVATSGGKLWRFKYRFEGKEKWQALGVYPDTGLAKARRLLADGITPANTTRCRRPQKWCCRPTASRP